MNPVCPRCRGEDVCETLLGWFGAVEDNPNRFDCQKCGWSGPWNQFHLVQRDSFIAALPAWEPETEYSLYWVVRVGSLAFINIHDEQQLTISNVGVFPLDSTGWWEPFSLADLLAKKVPV